MIATWLNSIADADMADWITVAAYCIAAMLCLGAASRAKGKRGRSESVFWRIITILLMLLGINELLDLQTLLTIVVRDHARANGWYGRHREVQYLFVIALGIGALIGAAITLWLTRRMNGAIRTALIGLGFIGLFILLRAASFHHLDEFLVGGAPSFNWGSIQEMIGIAIVGLAAFFYRNERRKTR